MDRISTTNLMFSQGQLTSTVIHSGYSPSPDMLMDSTHVFGVASQPQDVKVNGATANFNYRPNTKVSYHELVHETTANRTRLSNGCKCALNLQIFMYHMVPIMG